MSHSTPLPYSLSTVALFPELRKILKPQVIQILEQKGDELLIKKLNFIGPEGVSRLNCASNLILKTLSDENCFRIMSQELMDSWDYYWLKIKESGNNADKWMENMKEVEDLPFIMDKCWNRMQLNGVNPTLDHYLVYINCMGRFGIGPQSGNVVIDLKKQNYARRGADLTPTRLGRLQAWSKHISNEIPLIFYEYFTKDNPTDIPASMHEHFKKLEKELPEETEIANYFLGSQKGKTKPELLTRKEKEYEDFAGQWLQQDMIDQYLQPPLEKLYNVDDNRREQLEKEKATAKK
eukprot:CAMPEP_0117438826 /NCGR_PEP_ID=MMETSP0759-20121206/2254_1 /TAXON_ID=63605 /ORGANISM="Percolomonas cosmopolitus, Strain WS" /LENGTH=292 /DNA_ID=CAMNT_0005230531 /DNA_START=778 /DNA_END=1656 /DNA_ORIENTATION=+